ncbi:MAG: amidohydrolase family protein [Spirochaetales bacterium]|jgi:imidazolonepropionase-like amidohydrolase|nr:amidohydrolase family protein [Spirochaetales bacterium]
MSGIIIRAARILEGGGLNPLENGALAVRGGCIEFAGSSAEAQKKYPGYETLDLGDVTLLPGMIDCHSHTSMDAKVPGHLDMMNDPAPELAIRAVRYAREDLAAGITTVRVLGDKHYADVAVRRAINAGEIPGPRLLVAGIGMRGIHGHGFVGVPHTGVQEFRATCRENMLRKADWLKIFVTAGAPPVNGTHIPSFVSLEEIETVTGEAKRFGIRTSAHCIGGEGLVNCVKAGIDVIDHAYCATADDLKLIRDSGRAICLTPGVFMNLERNKNNPPLVARNTELGRQRVIEVMSAIVSSGVFYAIGSDALHGGLALEAAHALQLGASVREALLGVTVNAAALCGVNDRGRLSPGKLADIIAVEGNPLENIGDLKNLVFVMKDGLRYL